MIHEPKIPLSAGAIPPDSFDDILGLAPPDDFVVSKNRDGSTASLYGHLSWNFTAYDPDGHPSWLRFPFWNEAALSAEQERLARESRWLMFLLIWKNPGPALIFSTLRNYIWLFRRLADTALVTSCRIKDILTDEDRIIEFISSGISGGIIKTLTSFLSILLKLGQKETGLVVPGGNILRLLRKHQQEYRDKLKQTPPIPTRIYSGMITGLLRELDDFEAISDPLFALLTECLQDPLTGKSETTRRSIRKKLGLTADRQRRPTFIKLLRKHGLESYFTAKSLHGSTLGLSTALAEVQMVAKLLLQTYSGMRDEESTELPYYCLDTTVSDGRRHFVLAGRTTKLNNGLFKRTRWATSREGQRAVLVAQRVADAIYAFLGETPKPDEERMNEFPLFVSTAYLPLNGSSIDKGHGGYLAGTLMMYECEILRSRFLLGIEDEDLKELEQIDQYRSWRSEEKFEIGKEWPLSTHQLRRSLAIYAQRSGLVSLPSLRRQLQHITEEMTRYYARGSAFARNFIGDDPQHFGLEWQETTPVSAALSYILNVLHSDEILFGGHANWIERNLRTSDGVILVDREATIRRFKKGELSYRENILGGCTNVNECKQVAIKWLEIECIGNCTNLVGKIPKLEQAITAQKRRLDKLDSYSIEFRCGQEDLSVLIGARDRAFERRGVIGVVA